MGMATVGVISGAGMLGLSGVGTKGAVLPLFPFLPLRRKLPRAFDYEDVVQGRIASGWVEAEIVRGNDGRPALGRDGAAMPARLAIELTRAAETVASRGARVFAHLSHRDEGLVCDRLHERPTSALVSPTMLAMYVVRVLALVGLVIGFYEVVAMPLVESVVAPLFSTHA
ncbi:MAG: hypothetical protein H5U40_09245 [Polyangiaceae bacterium]|nr:hypothetical protein [Polyangiaceae bacterium]